MQPQRNRENLKRMEKKCAYTEILLWLIFPALSQSRITFMYSFLNYSTQHKAPNICDHDLGFLLGPTVLATTGLRRNGCSFLSNPFLIYFGWKRARHLKYPLSNYSHEKNARENESIDAGCHIRTELVDKTDKLKQPKLIKLVHVQLVWLLPVEILNLLTLFKWVAYLTVAIKSPRGEWSIKYTHKKGKERPKFVDRKIVRL